MHLCLLSVSSLLKSHNMDADTNNTLLIADELGLVRDGIAHICALAGRFLRISTCDNAAATVEMICGTKPSVALIDFQIPGMFSLELVRHLRETGTTSRIMIMSARGDRKLALETLRSGANGFFLKGGSGAELMIALERVLAGTLYVSPILQFEKVFMTPSRQTDATDPIGQLSSREYQVFQMLIDGVRARDIAARLSLSPKTVDTYRASLMRKLDIRDLPGLVRFAIQRDLTTV